MATWPIGVFASVDAGLGVAWDVIKDLQVPTIQLHAPGHRGRDQATAQQLSVQLHELGVQCTAIFGGFEGESYADLPTVARTVGLVPQQTRGARLEEMKNISDFAFEIGTDTVALHLGFIPENQDDHDFGNIVDATRELCDHCDHNNQFLHLETGQETAEGLLDFIAKVDRDNLMINFDPANMILYGVGEPIEALKKLAPRVRSVHCKDSKWSSQPSKTWGTEVPLGEGDVNVEAYLRTLDEIGYQGPLTIEREIPQDPVRQKEEIESAKSLLEKIRAEIKGNPS